MEKYVIYYDTKKQTTVFTIKEIEYNKFGSPVSNLGIHHKDCVFNTIEELKINLKRKNYTQEQMDKLVEKVWKGLEDITFYEKEDGELYIGRDYLDFKNGTSREDIWHWFDENHSKGIYYLLEELEEQEEEDER